MAFILILIIGTANVLATNVNFCPDLKPIHDFDEESLLGMWYIREYIFHKIREVKTETNPYCPLVYIRKFEDFVRGGLINRNLVSFRQV